MKKSLILILLVFFCTASFLLAQEAAPRILVKSVSPEDVIEQGYPVPSAGLATVGKGELVYVMAKDEGTYTWSFDSKPVGSVAAFDSVGTKINTFRPDMTGSFVVKLTTAGGEDMLTITSATYVGAGIPEDVLADTDESKCSPCHIPKLLEWAQSGHAYLFQQGIDGIASTHYTESCIDCHVLGLNPDPEAVNGGFDDIATELGWAFPAATVPGNWAAMKANYSKLAKLGSIQCENCHGPASEHRVDFEPAKMTVSIDAGACARCHDEPWRYSKSHQWNNSVHNFDQFGSHPTNAGCQPCHSGSGLIAALTGSEYNPTLPGNVSCAVCHDPHTATTRTVDMVTLTSGDEITFGGEGLLCMTCHHDRRDAVTYTEQYASRFGPHHSPQADMLAGKNAVTFGMYIASSTHRDAVENSCVGCHMAPTPGSGVAPVVDDPAQYGRDHIGEHSFAMTWDGGTPDDESDDIDNIAACARCHNLEESFKDLQARNDEDGDGTIESAMAELEGLEEQVAMMLPPVGEPTVTVTAAFNKIQLKAAYNYLFVEDDMSKGMHNFQYAVGLLKVAKAALEYGILAAGNITTVEDVPNDQGKQVRVAWTRFGGDGISNNPVKTYVVLRKVADMGARKNSANVLSSFEQFVTLNSQVKPGTSVVLEDGSWDVVATLPALGLDNYSLIAPTLFDSTKDAGVVLSTFKVMGVTANPSINAVSAPVSGYSIDNLAPMAPANVSGIKIANGVQLSWDEAQDVDFKFYTIYKSIQKNFDPSTTTPVAKLSENTFVDASVEAGKTYYYRLTATDFSGNEGTYSAEYTMVITGINGETASPKEFSLAQNYPNPFNPSTIIRFGLPNMQDVSVKIYDIRGSLVRTLAQGQFASGYHDLSWDGHNDSGNLVSAGPYIYQIVSNGEKITRKMVFLK